MGSSCLLQDLTLTLFQQARMIKYDGFDYSVKSRIEIEPMTC